jgi:Mrp family chromosome partitioning ATPase
MSEASENCTHDCSTCSENCSSRTNPEDFRVDLYPEASVEKVYAIVSGKGGVGKSMITSLLAAETQRRGFQTAILDADVTGPSIPKAFGIHAHALGTDAYLYPNYTKSGIQIMSTNMIVDHETDPVVWRGPVIAGVVTQFWSQVLWSDVQYMFVDMPPGTGDVPLTIFQSLPVDGIIVVTSPQDLVSMIVEKAVNMAKLMNIPVIGIVENMSYFKCPQCGTVHYIFGKSKIEETAKNLGVETVARLPIDPGIAEHMDAGTIEEVSSDGLTPILNALHAQKN